MTFRIIYILVQVSFFWGLLLGILASVVFSFLLSVNRGGQQCHSALKYRNISKILKIYGDTVIVLFPLEQSVSGTGLHTATHTYKQIPNISVLSNFARFLNFSENNLHRCRSRQKMVKDKTDMVKR